MSTYGDVLDRIYNSPEKLIGKMDEVQKTAQRKYYDTATFEQQLSGNYLDQFLLDTDRLAQSNTQTVSKPIKGVGRRISFRFRQAGANQSFQIASITVGFRPSGQQATKL